uniref:C-type lectin domain-containing protein n=1 Tax=Timema monikensis TaxID=170555 RepID=A0A7R9EC88_9NEOP|nr:unnamed protein product [Timema monikensis]
MRAPTSCVIVTLLATVVRSLLRCDQVERQPYPEFHLVRQCSRSKMAVVAGTNWITSLQRCKDFALVKRGLAFNFHPPGAALGSKMASCVVCECPEFQSLGSLEVDSAFDYYSMYAGPLPTPNHTCVPGVGVFRVHPRPANFTQARQVCHSEDGELPSVITEARTVGLAQLVTTALSGTGIKRAFVGLDDRDTEGRYVTGKGEPLSCFDYRAWAPGEPRDRREDDDCACVDSKQQWRIVRCADKLPFLCELLPGNTRLGNSASVVPPLRRPGDNVQTTQSGNNGMPLSRCVFKPEM